MDSVCRTCMRIINSSEAAISINNTDLREKLQVCLPELVLDNVLDPKMCTTCSVALSLSFRFKGMCYEAEKSINNCIQNKTLDGPPHPLNDIDLLTIGRNELDEAANDFIIAEEVEVVSSSVSAYEPLQILSDVASQASKAVEPIKEDDVVAKPRCTRITHKTGDDETPKKILNTPKNEKVHRPKRQTKNETNVMDDVKKAVAKLLKTPEYRNLVQLKTDPETSILHEQLHQLESIVQNHKKIKDENALETPTKLHASSTKSLNKKQVSYFKKISKADGRSLKKKQPLQKCETCGKVFKYISHLNVHKRAHVFIKSHACELCGKSFSLRRYLLQHTMSHFSVGDNQCVVCEKYFSSAHVLKKHQRTHTGEKKYQCQVCKRSFSQRVNLEVHMTVHTGVKKFVCYICNSGFGQKVHLEGHMRTHTGEKPYACDLCPKAYAKSNVLRDHKALHQRKPFGCYNCYSLYPNKRALKAHLQRCAIRLQTSSLGKVYNCGICSRCFITRHSRNRHMKVHVKDLIEGITTK